MSDKIVGALIVKYTKIFFACSVLMCSSASWASFYHYNHYAHQISPDDKSFSEESMKEPKFGLALSGALDSDRSTNYFGVFDFVIENKSDRWMILRDIRVSFLTPEQNQNVNIPTGSQFSAWSQGMQNADDYNKKKVAILSAMLGGVLAVKGGTQFDRDVGAFTTGLSLAALANVNNYNEILADLPPYHLLSGDIVVPPGLFMKRWLLVNSTNHKVTGYIHTLVLEFKDQDGIPQKYFMQFRNEYEQPSGGWQLNDFSSASEGEKIEFVGEP